MRSIEVTVSNDETEIFLVFSETGWSIEHNGQRVDGLSRDAVYEYLESQGITADDGEQAWSDILNMLSSVPLAGSATQ